LAIKPVAGSLHYQNKKQMKVAILGTGNVGHTVGSRLVELGHQVMMGSRTNTNEKALAFVAKHEGKATAGTYAEAAAFGEILINCTAGIGSIEALTAAGKENTKGKVLLDIANPLDFSNGMPPSLAYVNTNSLGEEIQKAFPELKVVKALNTMWCGIMVNPAMINGGDHNTFISGNDTAAKETVKGILNQFGWANSNILDLGDITTARGTEMFLAIWIRIYGATNNGAFNIKIVS
jgi:8-hydroxy-5-deazaflavin:NADPH oxidoreductase